MTDIVNLYARPDCDETDKGQAGIQVTLLGAPIPAEALQIYSSASNTEYAHAGRTSPDLAAESSIEQVQSDPEQDGSLGQMPPLQLARLEGEQ